MTTTVTDGKNIVKLTSKAKPKPLVTVIIPAKIRTTQEAIWLKDALESVPPKYPVILVNDHSPNFPEVKLKGLKLVELPEGKTGLAAARNYAMSFVKTKFFFPLDADDWLADNAIDLALAAYPGDGWLYGSTMLESEKQSSLYEARPYDICKLLEAVYWPNGCLQLTANWEKIKWDETLTAYEDWDYWLRSAKAGIVGHHTGAVLYHYRQNPNGIIAGLKSNPDMAERARMIIEDRHATLFDGVDPMCSGCGGGRHSAKKLTNAISSNRLKTAAAVHLPAQEGMTQLTFTGHIFAPRTYFGKVSGQRYRFGGKKIVGFVANEDVPGMLETKEFIK